jgi:hypothetical protein
MKVSSNNLKEDSLVASAFRSSLVQFLAPFLKNRNHDRSTAVYDLYMTGSDQLIG